MPHGLGRDGRTGRMSIFYDECIAFSWVLPRVCTLVCVHALAPIGKRVFIRHLRCARKVEMADLADFIVSDDDVSEDDDEPIVRRVNGTKRRHLSDDDDDYPPVKKAGQSGAGAGREVTAPVIKVG